MKLLLVTVTAIVVFTADGRVFRNKPGEQEPTSDDAQLVPEEIGDQDRQKLPQRFEIQMVKGHHERKGNKSSCKAKSTCVLLGGLCVTNGTLCSGRLVQGCKGTNCQCCVPGTIEAKLESLEEVLQSFKDNMNTTNMDLKIEIKSVSNNLNHTNSKLMYIKENMDNMSLNLNTKLETLKTNMSNMNTNINSKVDSLKSDMKNMISIVAFLSCHTSQGYFKIGNQCFKYLTDSARSWDAAKSRCLQLGLVLARPTSPVALRDYMLSVYGNKWTWLGARGSGSTVKWDHDGTILSSSNKLWWPSNPGSKISTSYCLRLNVHSSDKSRYPNQPYYMQSCTMGSHYALCEK